MKILVVGGSGLIGRVLCKMYSRAHEVHYTYNTNNSRIAGCTAHKLDVTSEHNVANFIKTLGPDIVINAGAIASVDI